MSRSCLTIILAAGQGTRMKSNVPKVLHPVGGLPMVAHVSRCADMAGSSATAIVIGHGGDLVRDTLAKAGVDATFHVQEKQMGTADAVNAARVAIDKGYDDVLVLFGDTPLVLPETLEKARAELAAGSAVCVVGFRPADPTGYGRLLEADGQLIAIREHKDATEDERKVTFCNGGLMAFNGSMIGKLIDRIGNDNAKGEFYMTDAVEVARSLGLTVTAIEAPEEHVLGVNTRVELAQAESLWQERQRRTMMLAGVSMQAPETVFLHHDTHLAPGVVLEPQVFFGPDVSVGAGTRIRAYSHLEGAKI
ncbi:MAG: NTP transferase domain-containing protein, partial [Pseudomonadota bacterium]